MKVPANLDEREFFYRDLIQKCNHTRQNRGIDYGMLRHYFLFGRAPDEDDTPYNKIYPHIDMLTAFLFASETTKFSIDLPASAEEIEYQRVPVLTRAVNDLWLNSNADQVFSQALTWSLVYNSMFVKLIVRVEEHADGSKSFELHPFPVDPSSFGVLREDLPYSDRQEAMVHSYYTTKSQLAIDLASHPHRESILARVDGMIRSDVENKPSTVDRLILSASSPNMIGNAITPLNPQLDYLPQVDEELIEMQELWLWDDDEHDYRVVTRAENDITIYDRKNIFLEGEHPFIQICPNPMYSYFWGMSETAGLIGLQRWRNERTVQMKNLMDKQVNPPTALTGWMGLLDEKNYALNRAGGYQATESMQAKVDKFSPDMPSDLFAIIHEIDGMFAERSGLQNIMMGKGESGVRSGRQTSELARLGSARIKKRALIIEDALEKMATLYLKCMRRYDESKYMDDKGLPFIAHQFDDEFVVKVDAHSNSPLFIEDQKQLAGELLEAHAISRRRFIDMIDPPSKEQMKRELKDIEAAEQKAKQEQAMMEAVGGGLKAVKK